jgi:hypothetical protein
MPSKQQPRFELPADQADLGHGPYDGAQQYDRVKPQCGGRTACEKNARGADARAGDQVIGAAAEHDEPDTAQGQRKAQDGDDETGDAWCAPWRAGG